MIARNQVGGVGSALKKIGRGVKHGARGLEHGAVAAAKGAGHGLKAGAGKFSPPWAGTRIGTKGWVTRLGQRLSTMGVPIVGVMCSMKKYRDSGFCKATGRIGW